MKEIAFPLDVDEEGWPPVAVEWLWVEEESDGLRVLSAPAFLPGLANRDVIDASFEAGQPEYVEAWRVVRKSGHSTIWVMQFAGFDFSGIVEALLALNCNVAQFRRLSYAVIDVLPDVPLPEVMWLLAEPEDAGKIAVAYPALRHGLPPGQALDGC